MKQAPVLNDREKQRMLQHLQHTSYGARNRCMLQLSWLAGMRVAAPFASPLQLYVAISPQDTTPVQQV